MQRTLVLALAILVSSVSLARADTAATIEAAQSWWDIATNSDTTTVPTKKKPLQYGVFPYAADACGAFEDKRVDKVTNKKGLSSVIACLYGALEGEGAKPEFVWEPSDADTVEIGFDYDKKLVKKLRKALKKMTIVHLEIRGVGDDVSDSAAVHIFFALDKKDVVRGVFMYVDAAG